MKIAVGRNSPVYAYIKGQIGVDTQNPGLGATRNWRIEMDNLGEAVHTGVGAPCTGHLHRRISDGTQRLLKGVLYGVYRQLWL